MSMLNYYTFAHFLFSDDSSTQSWKNKTSCNQCHPSPDSTAAAFSSQQSASNSTFYLLWKYTSTRNSSTKANTGDFSVRSSFSETSTSTLFFTWCSFIGIVRCSRRRVIEVEPRILYFCFYFRGCWFWSLVLWPVWCGWAWLLRKFLFIFGRGGIRTLCWAFWVLL